MGPVMLRFRGPCGRGAGASPNPKETVPMFCQQCGHPCSPEDPGCPRCGGPIGAAQVEASETNYQTPPDAPGAPGALAPKAAPAVGTGKPSLAALSLTTPSNARPSPKPGAGPDSRPSALANASLSAPAVEAPLPGPGNPPSPAKSHLHALRIILGALVLAVAGAALWWYQGRSGHAPRAVTTGTITPLQGAPAPNAQAPFNPALEPLPLIPEQDRRVVTVIPKGSTTAAPPTLWEHRQWVAKLRQGPTPSSCAEAARRLHKLHPLPENQARATLLEAFPDLCGTPTGERTPPAHPSLD